MTPAQERLVVYVNRYIGGLFNPIGIGFLIPVLWLLIFDFLSR